MKPENWEGGSRANILWRFFVLQESSWKLRGDCMLGGIAFLALL